MAKTNRGVPTVSAQKRSSRRLRASTYLGAALAFVVWLNLPSAASHTPRTAFSVASLPRTFSTLAAWSSGPYRSPEWRTVRAGAETQTAPSQFPQTASSFCSSPSPVSAPSWPGQAVCPRLRLGAPDVAAPRSPGLAGANAAPGWALAAPPAPPTYMRSAGTCPCSGPLLRTRRRRPASRTSFQQSVQPCMVDGGW